MEEDEGLQKALEASLSEGGTGYAKEETPKKAVLNSPAPKSPATATAPAKKKGDPVSGMELTPPPLPTHRE